MLGQCSLRHRFPVCSSGGIRTGSHPSGGWYLRFSLSYRDVEEVLAERGLHADHVTVEPRKVFQLLFVFLSPSGFLNTLVAKKSFFDLD